MINTFSIHASACESVCLRDEPDRAFEDRLAHRGVGRRRKKRRKKNIACESPGIQSDRKTERSAGAAVQREAHICSAQPASVPRRPC